MAGIATLAAQTPRPTTPPPMAVVTDLEPPGPPKIYRARMPVFTLVDTNVRYLPNRVITPSLGDLSAMVEQPRTVKSDGNVFIGASSKLPGSLTSPAFLIYIKKGKEVDSGIAVWETPNGNHLGVVSNYEFGPRFPRIASPPIIGASLLEKMQAAEAAKQAGSKKDGESSLKEGSETSSKDDIECGTNNDSESSFKNSSKTSFENHSQTSKNGSYASSNTASKTTFDPTMAPFYMASLLRLNPTLHKTLYQKTMDDIIAEFDAAQCVHPARYTVFVANLPNRYNSEVLTREVLLEFSKYGEVYGVVNRTFDGKNDKPWAVLQFTERRTATSAVNETLANSARGHKIIDRFARVQFCEAKRSVRVVRTDGVMPSA